MDDFLDWWESITNFGLSVAQYQNSKAEAQANREHTEKLQERQIHAKAVQEVLKLDKNALDAGIKQNNKDIDESLRNLESFNVNGKSLYELPEKYQTDEAKQLWSDYGIEVDNNLNVTFDTGNTLRQNLERTKYVSGITREISKSLTDMENKISGLQIHYDNVEKKHGLNLVKDIEDYKKFIEDNAIIDYGDSIEAKGLGLFPQDDPTTAQDEGWLGTAFTSEEFMKGGEPLASKHLNLQLAREAALGIDEAGELALAENEAREDEWADTVAQINTRLKTVGDERTYDGQLNDMIKSIGGKLEPFIPSASNDRLKKNAVASEYLSSVEDKILASIKYGLEHENITGHNAKEIEKWVDYGIADVKVESMDDRGRVIPVSRRKRQAVHHIYKLMMPQAGEGEWLGFRAEERTKKTVFGIDEFGDPIYSEGSSVAPKDMQINLGGEKLIGGVGFNENVWRYLNAMFDSWHAVYDGHKYIQQINESWIRKGQFETPTVEEGVAPSLNTIEDPKKSMFYAPYGSVEEEELNSLNLLRLSETIRRA